MAQYNSDISLETPAGTIDFDADTGDTYLIDPASCAGLDMAPLRTPIDQKPVTDGAIVHPFLKDAREITLAGSLRVRTVTSEDVEWVRARNALEDALNEALESIQAADGTLSWTPAGSARSLTVRCDVPATYPGAEHKGFIFGLVAGNPVIAIVD